MSENKGSSATKIVDAAYQPLIPSLVDAVAADQSRFDREIGDKYLGIEGVFDLFLLKGAPPDIYDELTEGRIEFPVNAAVLRPVQAEYEGKKYTRYEVVSTGKNTTNTNQRSDEHAEMVALRKAAEVLKNKHLPEDAIFLTTIEPCSACAKTFLNYGGKTLIFGANQSDLRGKGEIVNGVLKPWNTEPEGYSAKGFILEREPDVTVIGGYRRDDVLNYISPLAGVRRKK